MFDLYRAKFEPTEGGNFPVQAGAAVALKKIQVTIAFDFKIPISFSFSFSFLKILRLYQLIS